MMGNGLYPRELLIRLQCTEELAQALKNRCEQKLQLSAEEVNVGYLPDKETDWQEGAEYAIWGLNIVIKSALFLTAAVEFIRTWLNIYRGREESGLGRTPLEASLRFGIDHHIESPSYEEVQSAAQILHDRTYPNWEWLDDPAIRNLKPSLGSMMEELNTAAEEMVILAESTPAEHLLIACAWHYVWEQYVWHKWQSAAEIVVDYCRRMREQRE